MFFISREITLGEPPPQMMESIIDVGLWFMARISTIFKIKCIRMIVDYYHKLLLTGVISTGIMVCYLMVS